MCDRHIHNAFDSRNFCGRDSSQSLCGFVFDKDANNFNCPCHRGKFDVKTGAVLDGPPPRPLDELQVDIRDSAVFVKYKEYRLGVPTRVEA